MADYDRQPARDTASASRGAERVFDADVGEVGDLTSALEGRRAVEIARGDAKQLGVAQGPKSSARDGRIGIGGEIENGFEIGDRADAECVGACDFGGECRIALVIIGREESP